MSSNVFYKNIAVDEIMWKNMVETHRAIRLLHFACLIAKATDTHSEYVMFVAFP